MRATSCSSSVSAAPPDACASASGGPLQGFPPAPPEGGAPHATDSSTDGCLLPRSEGRERVLRASAYDFLSTGRSAGEDASQAGGAGWGEESAPLSPPPRCSCCLCDSSLAPGSDEGGAAVAGGSCSLEERGAPSGAGGGPSLPLLTPRSLSECSGGALGS